MTCRHPLVVEGRYNTYRDAKEWELAKTMAEVMVNRMPNKFEWLKDQVDAMTECGDPTGALQLLHDSSNRFGEDAQYIFALGRQYALLGNIEESKKFVKRESKWTVRSRQTFLMILGLMRFGIVFSFERKSKFGYPD